MAKKKLSFDLDSDIYLKMKAILESENFRQGDFLRQAVEKFVENQDYKIVNLYVIEDDQIKRKALDIDQYEVEIDDSCLTHEIVEDFGFCQSGFLTKNGQKVRFYSKFKIK